MKILLTVSFIASLFYSNALYAQTFDFLRQPISPTISSLGDNHVRSADINSIFFNPAAIIDSNKDYHLFLSFNKYILDINGCASSFSKKFNGIGTFAVSAIYINYGNFDRRDLIGQYLGNYSANDFSFFISFAKSLFDSKDVVLQVGASIKYIFSHIDNFQSSALAFDVGLFFIFPLYNIQISLSSLNLGAQLHSYNNIIEKLPYDLRFSGLFKLFESPFTISTGMMNLLDHYNAFFERFLNFTFGVEAAIENLVFVRLGFNNRKRINLKLSNNEGFQISGFSFGVGTHFLSYKIDYALYSLGNLGWIHQFSFSFAF